jgi:hypothetical protein
VTRRPARLPAALLALAVPLAGCAGTDPSEAAGPSSTSSASSSSVSSSTSSAPTSDAAPREAAGQRIEVQVSGGQVSGDTGRVPVSLGTAVTLVVTSDAADEIHVHGYDLTADLAPGQPAEVAFDATTPGVFEVELHDAGTVLLTLQVQ